MQAGGCCSEEGFKEGRALGEELKVGMGQATSVLWPWPASRVEVGVQAMEQACIKCQGRGNAWESSTREEEM